MLRVKQLYAKDVHGYIPINVKFKDKVTFLTGSNGCGKTTVLKIISAILQPDFDLINSLEFDIVRLTCFIDDKKVVITLSNDIIPFNEEREISWKIEEKYRFKDKKNEILEPLHGGIKLYPSFNGQSFGFEEHRKLKDNILLEFKSGRFFTKIQSYGSPLFLGINRQVKGDTSHGFDKLNPRIRERRRRRMVHNIGAQSNESLADAQDVIIDYVSEKADLKKQLVEKFKSNIFKSLFTYIPYTEKDRPMHGIGEKELEKKRGTIVNAIKSLELGNEIVEEVNDYFDSLKLLENNLFNKKLANGTFNQKFLNPWYVNRPHLNRIEKIASFSNEFQQKIDELDKPLNSIMEIANDFFLDSYKHIRIGANGSINVDWKNKEMSTRSLSSGEIQLIVIIIHLVFCEYENDPTVFVIDEPELSLHIEWQEKFVDAMSKASPSTQFILATHSPAIISSLENEKNCIYLKNI